MTNKEAIIQLTTKTNIYGFTDKDNEAFDLAIKALEEEITNDDLQAAMTESYRLGYELAETKFKRPTGKWIDLNSIVDKAKCSNCKKIAIMEPFGHFNFCPNCGAELRNN